MHVCWDHRVNNYAMRLKVLGKHDKSVDSVVNLHLLRRLGHLSRMLNHRLPQRAMQTGIRVGWKKTNGGQTKTWYRFMMADADYFVGVYMNVVTNGWLRISEW